MTIKEMPKICGTEELRLYDDNKVVSVTWINGASVTSFVEENLIPQQYVNREIDYIDISIEGCFHETLVMEIYLKKIEKST